MTKACCSFQKCDKIAGCRRFYNGATVFGWLLFTCLHPLSGSVEVNGKSWHLVTAIHDEGDGQILCEWQPYGCDCTHSDHVSFGFAGPDRIVTFKVSFSDFCLPLWTTELNCP